MTLPQAATESGAEFRAIGITKIQGADDTQGAWRYLLKWERLHNGHDWVRHVSFCCRLPSLLSVVTALQS